MEGRRAWTTLTMVSQNLARNIWINAVEREESAKDDLLAKVYVHDIAMQSYPILTCTIGPL